ncbi:response regulator [Maricaulis parjimensis]|uniref:response regulator n=1 Tax=Maricaulis parjimensis TaxID=144023 RepID=UPI00193ADA3D|nr:response regulator [Maricaulis parjimensis]
MGRVLLVEDDAGDAELVAEAVTRHSATLMLEDCRSAEAAWDLLRERAGGNKLPVCILLDMVMGSYDGAWLLSRMARHSGLRDIPVIVLSQKADAVARARTFGNVVGAMEKPVHEAERRQLVDTVLRLAGGMGVSA